MTRVIGKLAVIAGSGELPLSTARAAAREGAEVHVFVLRGQGDPKSFEVEFPTTVIRIGAAATAIDKVRAAGIQDLVFAGAVRRPSLLELRPDAKAAKVLGRGLLGLGDDGLLCAVLSYLEEAEGFRIHPVHHFLKGAKPEGGPLANVPVPLDARADIDKGRAVLAALAAADVGQAVAVQDGLVLAVEAIEGTDAMIARCAGLKRRGRGPVLVKMSKAQQTDRADLPAIGPETVRNAAKAGFCGIAVEAGRSIVVNARESARRAETAGLFLVAVSASPGGS